VAQVELRRVTWCSSLATLCLVLQFALTIIHGSRKAARNRGIHQVGTGAGTQPQTMMEQSLSRASGVWASHGVATG